MTIYYIVTIGVSLIVFFLTVDSKHKKFSKSFKDMVGLCLDQDPSRRPTAEKLSKHSFFKNCRSTDFLVKYVLQGLPGVGQRFRGGKIQRLLSLNRSDCGDDIDRDDEDDSSSGENVKQRRISGWNFNEEGFEMDPVFPSYQREDEDDDRVGKQVRFGDETVIDQEKGLSDGSSFSSHENEAAGGGGGNGGVDMGVVLESLVFLKKSLEYQRQQVVQMIASIRGDESADTNSEDQLMQVIKKLRMEIEKEKKKRSDLEMELEFLKLQSCNE